MQLDVISKKYSLMRYNLQFNFVPKLTDSRLGPSVGSVAIHNNISDSMSSPTPSSVSQDHSVSLPKPIILYETLCSNSNSHVTVSCTFSEVVIY